MDYIKKLNFKVDVDCLADQLLNNPQLFNSYLERTQSDTSPHKEVSDIWVRYGDFATLGDSVFTEEHDSIWYPIADYIPEAVDIAMDIMAKVKGERLGGVLITKLAPNGKVYPHRDLTGWHPNYYDKFYVPIYNKKGADFCFEGGTEVCPNDGEVHWFRNDITHWVNNDSNDTRLAMIVCIKPLNKEFLYD